ncbi:MAG: DUF6798 domain-containing protein [Bryobacteraceae bacterium]
MNRLIIAGAIFAIALLTFFVFPGHTWVQQDTQIYAPILEHLRDRSVLHNDILVQRPHVTFTLYDECALALSRATGADFEHVLKALQIATRALGVWGLYLLAGATGLAAAPALMVAAILSLGATVAGPSVLTLEYEPNPRGFAVPLLLLAAGMLAHGRYFVSGLAAAAAFLFHPPTVYPFWGVYFLLALWPGKPDVMRRRLYEFVPILGATILLAVASRFQAGVGETQSFFTRLTPFQEELQRMRSSYLFVSLWWRDFLPQYLFLFVALLVAYRRVRAAMGFDLRVTLIGMPLIGLLSVPVSWLLLEKSKWALMPQFQPMRALLFTILFALFAAAVAGVRAAERGRLAEAFAWLLLPFLAPTTAVLGWPGFRAASVAVALAALSTFALAAYGRRRAWAAPALAAVAAAAFFAMPGLAGVVNYPRLHTPELDALAAWARANTPPDAVFLFGDARKSSVPGIFRFKARRAVYTDWKSGGQVNYLRELGDEWWSRWQRTGMNRYRADRIPLYRSLGIDYLVLSAQTPPPGIAPQFHNRQYAVFKLR